MTRKPNRGAVPADALAPLIEAFASIGTASELRRFFDEIFTPTERRDLALRWELMRRLQAGVPQRQIAADLGISLCKITRGSKVLKHPESVSRRVLESPRP